MNISKMRNKYILMGILLFVVMFSVGCGASPIKIEGSDETMYMPIAGFTGIMDILVIPMAGLMWVLGKTIAFGNYAVVILLATVIIRTIAWPIYGKQNGMSLKMQLMQPEMSKIQRKYGNRKDPQSQQPLLSTITIAQCCPMLYKSISYNSYYCF